MQGAEVLGPLLIGLNTAAAFSCAVSLYLYFRTLVRAYLNAEPYLWMSWAIVLSSLAGILFFGSFAVLFHFARVDPLSSSMAPLPIRFLYLAITLASTAAAVAARYRDTPMGAGRTFILWSLLVAAGVVLLTSYEAGG